MGSRIMVIRYHFEFKYKNILGLQIAIIASTWYQFVSADKLSSTVYKQVLTGINRVNIDIN